MLVEPDAGAGLGHDIRERGLADLKRIAPQIVAVQVACFVMPVLAVPGARSIVGTGDVFGDRLTEPIRVPRRSVCLSKRDRDAGFVEGIEDGESQIRACATTFVEVVNERVEFEVESVCTEIKIDGRSRRRRDIGIGLGDLEKSRPDLTWIAAVAHGNRDHDAANVVAKGPILYLFGDETGIWNENAGSLGGLDLGRTNADFAHMALLAAYNYQVTNLDRSLRQEDQTGHEIIDHALQAETNTDGERPSQDGQIGKIEACIGKRSKRRDHNADVAHADADRVSHPARNPGGLQDSRI